jgi:hypothetical protein
MVLSRALAFMTDPALAASVLPASGQSFSIPDFLGESGTLYMIADSAAAEAPLAPLFACMANDIHWTAVQMGQASPGRRLDPPLLMALDEVTQICQARRTAARSHLLSGNLKSSGSCSSRIRSRRPSRRRCRPAAGPLRAGRPPIPPVACGFPRGGYQVG